MEYLTGPLIAFIGIAALVICTPGPDTAMTIRNALLGGRSAGLATALGVSTGPSRSGRWRPRRAWLPC